VSGGESGGGARPSHPAWHRATRDFCLEHSIPYHFKQHGNWLHQPERAHFKELAQEEWRRVESQMPSVRPALMFNIGKPAAGAMLDGREWREFPA
jgi:protein gp37